MPQIAFTIFTKNPGLEQDDSGKLPLLSNEEIYPVMNGEIKNFNLSYLPNLHRYTSHFYAKFMLKVLYQSGAIEINRHAELMDTYQNIPLITLSNGSHKVYNSFHALYTLKIGLDSLKPEEVFQIFNQLKKHALSMTLESRSVTMPDGSQIANEFITHHIFHLYIQAHLTDKFAYLSAEEKAQFVCAQDPSEYLLVCDGQSAKQKELVNFLLSPNSGLLKEHAPVCKV